jgi:cold shock CspA family protein
MRGKIASIETDRDFGFITPDEEGGEIYFHRSALHGANFDDLGEGIAVEFMLGQEAGDRPSEGLRAVDVQLAPDAVSAAEHEMLPADKMGLE